MLSSDSLSHSHSNVVGNGHGHGQGGVRFNNGASSGSNGHDHHGRQVPAQYQQHHHHHSNHQADHHIQGHALAAFPSSTSITSSAAPTAAQVARLRTQPAHDSPVTRTQSAPPPAAQHLALPAAATAADNGHPRQPPKKKLRPSHPLPHPLPHPLATATPSSASFGLPAAVHGPLALTATANYDVDAFARLAVGARSGHSTRPPVVDAGVAAAAASLTSMAVVDRRVQAQAARRMRERAGERAGVVQWLVHLNAIHASFRFAPETIYTGVQYMDRALASSPTARKHLAPRKPHMYLLAVVCLTLAAKYAEEYAAPSVAGILAALAAVPPPAATATGASQPQAQVVQVMPAWTQKHVLAMERKVLEALDFDLAAVAPSAAVFELLFANVDLAVELCALVMSGGQSAVVSPTGSATPGSPPMASPASSGSPSAAAAGFMSPGASPRSIASSTSSSGMVPPSPVSPTGAFGHDVFMAAPHQYQQQQQASRSRSSFGATPPAAARPYPPPVAPPTHGASLSAAQAKWTLYSAPAHHQDHHQPDPATGDLSPMDVDASPDKQHMCMMTPPHTPPRAPPASAPVAPSPTPSDERWPAALSSPTHRNLIARLVRAVQTELVQRVLVHAQGTAHAPLNTAVVLLNRAVVCLAAANRAAAAAAAAPAPGAGLDPSPMATPGATGTVTVAGSGAAVAQVAGIVSRVECVVTEHRGRAEWGACVEMVRQAVGGQVVGLAA